MYSLIKLCYYCLNIVIQVKQKQLQDPKIIFTSSDIEKGTRLKQDKQIL